jgi:hypothetical protein
MKSRCDFYSDTDPAAFEVFLDLQRKMPPEDKLAMVFGMIRLVDGLAESVLRQERPDLNDHEIKMRLASRRLDRETMIRAYGWDPKAHA